MISIDLDQGKLDAAIEFLNKKRAADNPPLPPFTAQGWVELRMNRILESTLIEAKITDANTISAAFTAASKDDQDKIKELLKLDKAAGELP